ncbi:MAG TPA: 50S ribosomal protein L5 [Candidatus Saccharimonadales bacterium]
MAEKTLATPAPRLKALYDSSYRKELQAELKLENVQRVPKLEKITVSVGTGKSKDDKRHLETVKNTLTKITGQAPVERLAKKSIATFKIRAGMGAPVGVSVTLRGARMYEFLDRLVNVALPRVRDFHGVKAKAFDRQGNYSLGILEQSIFPELTFEETQVVHGLQVTFTVANGSKENTRAMLEKFGIPFEKAGGQK